MIRIHGWVALLGLVLVLPALAEDEDEVKLWPPREGGKKAVIAASQALWWNKDDPKARILKARALDFSGRYAEAEQAALSALEIAPQDPSVQRILGRSLLHQNKIAAAKAALERAGELGDHILGSLGSMLRPDRMSTAPPAPAISRSLVQIQDENGRVIGSGCWITADGVVLTAAHVVAGKKTISVRNALGKIFPVKKVCPGDFSADAVLLECDTEDQMFLRFAEKDSQEGDPLFVTGFPLAIDLPLTSRGTVRFLSSGSGHSMVTTAPMVPGQSGSPVLNEQGRIVGIASRGSMAVRGGGAPARSEAVPLSALLHLQDLSLQSPGFVDVKALPDWTGKNPFFDPAVAAAEQTVLNQDYEKAEKAISAAIDRHPNDAGLYLRRAMVRVTWGHPSDAEADGRLAAAYGSQDAEPRRFLCALLLSMGRREEAVAFLEEAYRLTPDDSDTAEGLSELLISMGRYEQARQPAEEATRLNPDSARAWSMLAASRLATGRLDGAKEAAMMATTKGPTDPRSWIQLAACSNALKDFPTASMAAEKVTQLAPGDPRGWLNLATAQTGNNQFEEAVRLAEKAAQLDPKNRATWNLLAALYAELHRPEDAEKALAQAKSIEPEAPPGR